MAILLIDNYDSFTFNLAHYLEQFDCEVIVRRNDSILLSEVNKFSSIVISPGPGLPCDAGISLEIIKTFAATKKILGVCLGHQAIAEAFGGKLKNMRTVLHGVSRPSISTDIVDPLLLGFPRFFECGRYHSWTIDPLSLPFDFDVLLTDNNNEIMAIKHKKYNLRGVQFHPESILTHDGLKLIENWVKHC